MSRTVDSTTATILLTRPNPQNAANAKRLRAEGFTVIELPLLEIQATLTTPRAKDLRFVRQADCLIFTSVAAVRYGRSLLAQRSRAAIVAAIGRATAAELQANGCTVDLIPQDQNSEGLLREPSFSSNAIAGQSVALISGVGGRRKLAMSLRQRKAEVRKITVYRRSPIQPPREGLDRLANQSPIAVFTSGEALRFWARLAQQNSNPALLDVSLLVASPRLCKLAQQLGYRQPARLLPEMSVDGLLMALHESGK